MEGLLKHVTARDVSILMIDSADHVTGKTGLTLTINASKNAQPFAVITPTVVDRGFGWYSLALTLTDCNTFGDLDLHITAPGADPTDVKWQVVARLPGEDPVPTAAEVAAAVLQASVPGNSGVTDSLAEYIALIKGTMDAYLASIFGVVLDIDTIVTTSGVAVSDAEREAIAAKCLMLDWTTITGEASRSLLNALRASRNKTEIVGGTLKVYKENDTTLAWTAAIATDPAAEPITSVDPA